MKKQIKTPKMMMSKMPKMKKLEEHAPHHADMNDVEMPEMMKKPLKSLVMKGLKKSR